MIEAQINQQKNEAIVDDFDISLNSEDLSPLAIPVITKTMAKILTTEKNFFFPFFPTTNAFKHLTRLI